MQQPVEAKGLTHLRKELLPHRLNTLTHTQKLARYHVLRDRYHLLSFPRSGDYDNWYRTLQNTCTASVPHCMVYFHLSSEASVSAQHEPPSPEDTPREPQALVERTYMRKEHTMRSASNRAWRQAFAS